MRRQRLRLYFGAFLFWVISTSFIGWLNNRFYYNSKESEIGSLLSQYIQTIDYLYKGTPAHSLRDELDKLLFSTRYSVIVDHFNDDKLDWQHENNARKELDRSVFIKEVVLQGKIEGQYLRVKVTAYVTPPWWKALLRSWFWSFWEIDGWWKYRLYQRSVPLWSYAFAVAGFGWCLKKILDKVYEDKINEALNRAHTAEKELREIEGKEQNLSVRESKLIETEKQYFQAQEKLERDKIQIEKDKESIHSISDQMVKDLSEKENSVAIRQRELDERAQQQAEERSHLKQEKSELAIQKEIALRKQEQADKVLNQQSQSKKEILKRTLVTEISEVIDLKVQQRVQLQQHSEYPHYKKAADKIRDSELFKFFTTIKDCAYRSGARKRISVLTNDNCIELILDRDSGCGLHLQYKPIDNRYSQCVGYSLALLIKYLLKDFNEYKIKVV